MIREYGSNEGFNFPTPSCFTKFGTQWLNIGVDINFVWLKTILSIFFIWSTINMIESTSLT
jgi:hypothetical protein